MVLLCHCNCCYNHWSRQPYHNPPSTTRWHARSSSIRSRDQWKLLLEKQSSHLLYNSLFDLEHHLHIQGCKRNEAKSNCLLRLHNLQSNQLLDFHWDNDLRTSLCHLDHQLCLQRYQSDCVLGHIRRLLYGLQLTTFPSLQLPTVPADQKQYYASCQSAEGHSFFDRPFFRPQEQGLESNDVVSFTRLQNREDGNQRLIKIDPVAIVRLRIEVGLCEYRVRCIRHLDWESWSDYVQITCYAKREVRVRVSEDLLCLAKEWKHRQELWENTLVCKGVHLW